MTGGATLWVILVGLLAFGVGWLIGRRRSHALELELAAARAEVRSAADVAREREQALELALTRLRTGFDTVAGEALRGNSETFLQLARQVLGQQHELATRSLAEREKAVETMLAPVRDALQRTHEQIARIEKERAETFGALRSSIEGVALGQQALQRETRNLVTALRRPEVRGQWGEMTLRRLAELAGMIEHCDFAEQVTVQGEDGSLRPDMIVNMPDGRQLVVDVKTPLDAYLSAVEATTDEDRAAAIRRHAQAVVERVRQLASKSYWTQFEHSPDFVVLFIPGDQFVSAAIGEVPTLLEDAIRQHVIIATPTSFIALLKAVAYGWRQNALAENAAHIQELAEELYKRLATFGEHLARIGRSLGQSVDAYNSAVGSLERQVLPGARKFTELGLRPGKEIGDIAPVDKLARVPKSGDGDGADE
ncbi:MAG TPA: DNA recombination protein RmuC [Steroidobacteraceae bacterium]|nr:DNA recombination protein RmuC [Steroidobacteraceae bacterium]